MNVLAYSPHADCAQAAALGVRLVSLDELLSSGGFRQPARTAYGGESWPHWTGAVVADEADGVFDQRCARRVGGSGQPSSPLCAITGSLARARCVRTRTAARSMILCRTRQRHSDPALVRLDDRRIRRHQPCRDGRHAACVRADLFPTMSLILRCFLGRDFRRNWPASQKMQQRAASGLGAIQPDYCDDSRRGASPTILAGRRRF